MANYSSQSTTGLAKANRDIQEKLAKESMDSVAQASEIHLFGQMMSNHMAELKDRSSILKTANDMAGQ